MLKTIQKQNYKDISLDRSLMTRIRMVRTMAEYIERERTVELLRSLGNREYRKEKGTIQDAIKMISYSEYTPAADVAPVRHGRWIDVYPDIEPNPMFMYGICSECGFEQGISKYLNYCPNCGTKMESEG